jgi:hypothetical protein
VAHAAEERILCPNAIDAAQDEAPSPGWRVVKLDGAHLNGRTAALSTAGMLHGPPEESGYLAPIESKGSKHGNRSKWVQQWKFDRPHWYQTFVYCGYGGASAPLQLFRPIAEDATACTLTSSTTNGAVNQMEFVCK